jgi:cell division protein FtsB
VTITTEEIERLASLGDAIPIGARRIAAALRSLAAERDALQADVKRLKAGGCARDQSTTQFCAEAVALQAENARLRPESRKLRRLVRDLLENDPDDMAADAVTVLDVWRKEARAALGEKE